MNPNILAYTQTGWNLPAYFNLSWLDADIGIVRATVREDGGQEIRSLSMPLDAFVDALHRDEDSLWITIAGTDSDPVRQLHVLRDRAAQTVTLTVWYVPPEGDEPHASMWMPMNVFDEWREALPRTSESPHSLVTVEDPTEPAPTTEPTTEPTPAPKPSRKRAT